MAEIGNKVRFVDIDNTNTIHEMEIQEFIDYSKKNKNEIYVYDMKRRASNLSYYLLKNGYVHSFKKIPGQKTFAKRVKDQYTHVVSLTIHSTNKEEYEIEFIEAIYNIPIKVSQIRETGLEGEDLQVLGQFLSRLFARGFISGSIGSSALNRWFASLGGKQKVLNEYKTSNEEREFSRKAYRGGWCYLEEPKEKVAGYCVDVRSLYPYIMRTKLLPCGFPKYFEGEWEPTRSYDLAIMEVEFNWLQLKPGKAPCAKVGGVLEKLPTKVEFEGRTFFSCNETKDGYIMYADEPVRMTITNIDLDLIKESYDYGEIEYIQGYRYQSSNTDFVDYIDFFIEKKENSVGVERIINKLYMNALSGKFAQKTVSSGYDFVLEDDIEVRKSLGDKNIPTAFCYPALSAFITAYGRAFTIRTYNANPGAFYSDTDSIHGEGSIEDFVVPKEIMEDYIGLGYDSAIGSSLGQWGIDAIFTDCRFIGQKCYGEKIDGEWDFTIAGLEDEIVETLQIEDFYKGSKIYAPIDKYSKDGIDIIDAYFTIGAKLIDQK